MLPHKLNALRLTVLRDLRVGQSTADAIAQRYHLPTQDIEEACATLLDDRFVETRRVAEVLTAYRITTRGLESIA